MAALPYIQLYVADYLADTQHLTTEEHGAYMLLIFSYWQTGKPLRIDRLATVARLSNERWANVEETLKEFFHVVGQHWHHFRIEADLEAVNSKSAKASDAGKASAKARALKQQQESNERSADVESNDEQTYQRNGNHTDTDTDTDTDTEESKTPAVATQPPSAKKKNPPAFDPLTAKPVNAGDAAWADYIASRKPRPTQRACELIAEKLRGLSQADVDATLLNSVANGWTGVFPEKNHATSKQSSSQSSNSAVDQVKRAIAEREARSSQAQSIHDRQAVAEDDGDLRPPLDVEFRRVG